MLRIGYTQIFDTMLHLGLATTLSGVWIYYIPIPLMLSVTTDSSVVCIPFIRFNADFITNLVIV